MQGKNIISMPSFSVPSVSLNGNLSLSSLKYLVTAEPSDISETQATLNGVVIGSYTECGFVWGTSANPTVNDNKQACTPSNYEIQYTATSLSANTLYHYRTYGLNGNIASYGDDEVLTTQLITPLLVTDNATNQTTSSFTGNGLIFDYNRPLAEQGFVYGSAQYPVIGVGDATKVALSSGELVDYRYSKQVSNISSQSDLYYRTFGTKTNGLTFYSLASKLCYNSIPCVFYDYLKLKYSYHNAFTYTFSSCNFRYWQENYFWCKALNDDRCNFTYNDKSFFGGAGDQVMVFYNTDGTNAGRVNGYVEVEVEINNYDIIVNGVDEAAALDTASEYLEENKDLVIYFRLWYDRDSYFYGLKSKASENGETYFDLRPCQLIADLPASRCFDGLAHTSGTIGFYEVVSRRFMPSGYLTEVGNDE